MLKIIQIHTWREGHFQHSLANNLNKFIQKQNEKKKQTKVLSCKCYISNSIEGSNLFWLEN